MDSSFKGSSGFFYRGGKQPIGEPDAGAYPGLLDVYVRHARNIHNICIYADQDVYAKFSLTCNPDDAISTRIIAGGGKNPQFNESLTIEVPNADAVLKCEIWMLSRARNYLEDQLLGFALVPVSSVAASAKRKLTQDFTLSSTDLFHSPAGTVQLTLTLHASSDKHRFIAESCSTPDTSITSEVVILDPAEFGRIEFPDINITRENQQMVSQYFDMAACHSCSPSRVAAAAPFLQLGASSQSIEDYEMAANSSYDNNNRGSDSPDASIQNSGPFTSSTTTSLSDDMNSADSVNKKNRQESSNKSNVETNHSASTSSSPETPTSKCEVGEGDRKEDNKLSIKEEAEVGGKQQEMGSVFKSPMININLEAEQNAMQQQIVDMYMRSMHQFTESLAKMKLPMDLDVPKADDGGDVIQSQKTSDKSEQQKKKDGARVFYGSRAFF